MQRRLPIFVLGCRVRAGLNEEPREIEMTAFGCRMQRSHPIFVLGCRVRAVLNEEPREIEMTA